MINIDKNAFISYLQRAILQPGGLQEPITMDGIDNFLFENSSKNIEARFISYCIKLNTVTIENYSTELYQKIIDYENYANENFNFTTNDIFELVPEDIAKVIEADVPRIYGFFKDVCNVFSVSLLDSEYALIACKRILALIAHKRPDIGYIQGYDRYMIYCFSMALKIVQSIGIQNKYAEGLSFDLTIRFLEISNVDRILTQPHTEIAFIKIDECVGGLDPRLATMFTQYHISSILFATGWRILLFTHVHPINDTLLIWDRFLLHLESSDDFENYFVASALAHVKQVIVDFKDEDFNPLVIETIQKYENYNLNQILIDTEAFYASPPHLAAGGTSATATIMNILGGSAKLLTRVAFSVGIRVLQHTLAPGSTPSTMGHPTRVINFNTHSATFLDDFAQDISLILYNLYD